jgi:hypothetical protein
MRETYDERRDRERRDPHLDDFNDRGPGHETYDEQVGRWRREWSDVDDRQELT